MPPSSPSDADRERPAPEANLDEVDLDADLWPDSPGGTSQGMGPVITNDTPRTRARDRIRTERKRFARRRRRIRVLAASAGVLVLAAAATAAGVGITSHHGRHATPPAPFGYQGPYAPVTLSIDNSVTMARSGVTGPVIAIYEDFQCPACRAFEKSDGAVIQLLDHRVARDLDRAAPGTLDILIDVEERLGDARPRHGHAVVHVECHRRVRPLVPERGWGGGGGMPAMVRRDADGGGCRRQHEHASAHHRQANPPAPPGNAFSLGADAVPR